MEDEEPHSRAQRMFTSSTGVYPDGLRLYMASAPNASCMITGMLCPIGNHRQDVPSVRFGACDDAHLQGVDLRSDKGARQLPASREENGPSELRGRYEDARAHPRQHLARSQGAPTSVPGRPRWRGQLAVGRSEEETRRPSPVQGVLLLRFFRGGVQTMRTGSDCFSWVEQPCELSAS